MPSLRGGKLADDALRMMKGYFQDAVISLDPVRRLTRGNVDYYFGLSVFLLAVFGAVCGKKRSLHGFWAGLIIFACTTTSMCAILQKYREDVIYGCCSLFRLPCVLYYIVL